MLQQRKRVIRLAERRMFAKTIIDSDAFLDMPLSSQALYFHLSMRADDDGFINNPRKIQRSVGATDDDLKLLILKQFILIFESGIIVIRHWRLHNYIQKDRYKPTIYQNEKAQLSVENNGVYEKVSAPVSNLGTSCIQDVYSLDTQVRLGKDRIELGEDRGESTPSPASAPPPKKSPPKAERHKHGEYKHVLLTEEQLKKLNEDFGNNTVAAYIRKVDEYCQQTGKTYKDYNLTIRNWIGKDGNFNGNDGNKDFSTDTEPSKYAIEF